MTEKVVSVRLRANVEGFTAGMRKAKASVDDLTKADVPKAAAGYKDLSSKAALAGAAIAVGLGVAVKRFAEFDATMSAVKANVGGTASEMESLRNAAIKLGADSQFSANEAAQGINELGKAGIASADILNGGLKGALDLAAAGQVGVAQAAGTTATALSQFKLGGDKAVHVADLLAAGANKAQGGVGDLGAALGQAGLVAAGMGVSIEETTGTLAAFAKAGLIGSDAGTSFKTMIQRLQAPIGDAKAMLDKYSISAYDASGNFVGLASVAGQLQDRFKDLTPQVRNNALAVIFGSDAIRGANVLYEQGAAGISKWTDEVNQTGFAAKQAADLTDNLKGDIERLGGAFDSVLISSGSSANASLRTIVQSLQGLVEVAGRIPGPVLLAGTGLAAMALVVPKGVKSVRELSATMTSLGIGLDGISAKAPRTGAALGLAAKGAGLAAKAFVAAAVASTAANLLLDDAKSPGVEKLTSDLVGATDAVSIFSEAIRTNASDMGLIQGDLGDFGDVLRATFNPDFLDSFNKNFAVIPETLSLGMVDLTTTTDEAATRFSELDSVLTGLVSSGQADKASAIFDQFAAAAAEQGVNTDQLMSKLPGFADLLASTAGATDKVKLSVAEMSDNLSLASDQTDSVSAAIIALGGSADGASEEVKNLAKVIETDMEAASKAFGGDLDVIAQYDPEKASGKLDKATKASADAEKKLQDVRERIGAKKKRTVSDNQALEAATAKAAEARAAKVAAADEATGQSLGELYKESVKTAKKFAKDIQTATERGLDPNVVAKLLEAGPEQAGPVLDQLLGDHSANMIQMVNDAETALAAVNQQIVQQSRLTSIAVNASSDEVAGHLDEATRIIQAKAASQGSITAEELAAQLKLPLETVTQVAQEYGITLEEAVPPEIGTYIKVTGVPEAKTELDLFHTAVEDIPPAIGTYVNAPGAAGATTQVDLFHTAVTDLPDSKDVPVTTSGVPTTVEQLLGVKNVLDGLHSKTITITTAYQTFRQGERDSQDPTKKALGGAIYGAGTGTSDSIPALLSNGEHVLTAAEVAKLGGQSAAYALRAAIRAGRMPGFAAGGAVATRYAPAVSYAGPTSYSTKNDYGLTADQVTIVTSDPNSFKREIRTAPYRAKGRPGR